MGSRVTSRETSKIRSTKDDIVIAVAKKIQDAPYIENSCRLVVGDFGKMHTAEEEVLYVVGVVMCTSNSGI